MATLEGCVEVGKVGKAHGIRGEFRILSYSGQPDNFQHFRELLLQDRQGQTRICTLQKARSKGQWAIVRCAGVTDRNQAEELTGHKVWVTVEQLPELDDDEFYWHDIIGAQVQTVDGVEVGVLRKLFAAGPTEMLVVKQGEDEVFIPARPEFLHQVSSELLVVDLPPGLLELNKKER